MAPFNMRVFHRGRFATENGIMKYVDGEETVIEELDSDRWSVFEAYYELEQLGYADGSIASLWYKDPTTEAFQHNYILFGGDADAIAMWGIAEAQNVVELYVVHQVQEAEEFPEAGYIDVGPNEDHNNGRDEAEERLGDDGGTEGVAESGAAGVTNVANDEDIGQGEENGEDNANYGTSSEEDTDDGEYVPSASEVESVEDVHFTDSEEEFDDDSGFEDLGGDNEMPRGPIGNNVAHENLSDLDGVDSDEMEADHEIGGYDEEDGDAAEGVERRRFPVFKPQKDMVNYRWQLGTLFASRDEFKEAVATYAVQAARGVKFDKCDMRRVRAKCVDNCPFRVYAVKLSGEGTWQLRSMNLRHNCMQAKRVSIMHSKWLGKQFKKKVEENPKLKVKELVAKAQKKWNLTVTTSMAARTKQIALDQIQGTFKEQYKRIYDYCGELLRTNPGSSVKLKVIRSPDFENDVQSGSMTHYTIFQRLYICLDACKKSFQHCRPFIGLDGCFLKTPQGGMLLTAIAFDPNDQMLPLAWAVVEAECKDSWVWFLQNLMDDLGSESLGRCTFMSDQQKALLPTFEEVIPGVDNRFCVRHLYNNFRKKFPGLDLKQMMWRCSKETHWRDWEKGMKAIRKESEEGFRHLNKIPPRYWSRSRFTFHSKVETVVNNICESFNAIIGDAREKPIVTMLEEIRVYAMTRWAHNRENIISYQGNILPRIRRKLELRVALARFWRPNWSSAQKYEVVYGEDKFVVDLAGHECSCRRWQLSGIPCPHAICCIHFKGLDLEQYVDNCYKKEAYVKCYEHVINPLNGPDLWERTDFEDVMPPPYKRPSHRPTKKRRRGHGEDEHRNPNQLSRIGQIQRCSNCGEAGHKKRGCTKPAQPVPKHQNQSQSSKKERGKGHTSKNPPKLPTRGGKNASSQAPPTTKNSDGSGSKKKATSQPNPTTQKRTAAASKKPNTTASTRAKQPIKAASSQPNPLPHSAPKQVVETSSSQPTMAASGSGRNKLGSTNGKVTFSNSYGPHVSPKKLRQMAKLPPSKWGNL